GCGTIGPSREKAIDEAYKKYEALEEPPAMPRRTAEMPLVAVIPGLNVPFAPTGSQQFGKLMDMLAEYKIPAFVVAYDEKVYPLSNVAGLYSGKYPIALMRVVPVLSDAIEKENKIRKSQSAPPLEELDLVSYSQGSVLALDVIRYVEAFKWYWQMFVGASDNEWKELEKDPEFQLFCDDAGNYLALNSIRSQNTERFDRNFSARRFAEKLSEKLIRSFERLRLYLLSPEKLFPGAPIASGNQAGYPRRYPKVIEYFEKNYPGPKANGTIPLDFWMQYVEYKQLLNIRLRLFSMAGSFFGSPEANEIYPLYKELPGLSELIIGPVEGEIKDTQLGSRYHLWVIKDLIEYAKDTGKEKEVTPAVYFIVGANGDKGDGLVGQSSAHFSSHLLTEIPLKDLFSSKTAPLHFESERLPAYNVTGLRVYHLPHREFIFIEEPGIAQIDEKSKVYPFLVSFLGKDLSNLRRLHDEHNQGLRQFMVELSMPLQDELNGARINLKTASSDIKINHRYYNSTAHTFVWTGVFTNKEDYFNAMKSAQSRPSANVMLTISKDSEKTEIELEVNPGTNHFVEIAPRAEEKPEWLKSFLPRLYELQSGEALVEEPKQ
ncbi:MAG: hypothetical protein PHE61_05265, partial [Candidatus Omnitrophica bacterium]|nr:hypothetical protein [Candidatus Omnitrophota bacterium]